MEKILTVRERVQLIQCHRKERDGRVRDRIKTVLAYDDGYSYSEIAKILLLDDETIRRYIEGYLDNKKLNSESGGSDSKLTHDESRRLTDHLQETTYLYVKDICQYVQKQFNTQYSVSGMTKWLHAHCFCYKKPHAVPAKADKIKQAAFIEYYNDLKDKSGKNEPIYFTDSVHPQYQTQLVCGWIMKGERKAIAMTGRQPRLNFIGGICLDGHRFIYRQSDTVDTTNINLFLKKLRKNHPADHNIHVIWDNAGYHRSKDVKAYAKELKIILHYLPAYSPNLNPIERMWKLMHESVRYNQYYDKFSTFTDVTLNFFKNIGRKKCILRNRITDNFQILHSPLFAV